MESVLRSTFCPQIKRPSIIRLFSTSRENSKFSNKSSHTKNKAWKWVIISSRKNPSQKILMK